MGKIQMHSAADVLRIQELLLSWFGGEAGVCVEPIAEGLGLLPEEEAAALRMVPRRRAEFAAGRKCARTALAMVGGPVAAIPIGVRYAPVWPAGYTGSITHSAGLSAAVALPHRGASGIGIDIVDLATAGKALADAGRMLNSPAEETAARVQVPDGIDPRVVLFSAKESVIKAVSSRADRFLAFTEIEVDLAGRRFKAQVAALDARAEGWWEVPGGLLVTGARRGV